MKKANASRFWARSGLFPVLAVFIPVALVVALGMATDSRTEVRPPAPHYSAFSSPRFEVTTVKWKGGPEVTVIQDKNVPGYEYLAVSGCGVVKTRSDWRGE